MQINQKIFQQIRKANGKILVVTKYWDRSETENILSFCEKNYADIFLALGENRVKALETKRMSREKVHFIGNIQSKKISKIIQFASVIHSLENLKHAQILEKEMQKQFPKETLKVFIQIKLDPEKTTGILAENLPEFLRKMEAFKHLEVCGISGMGKYICEAPEKRNEFLWLKKLRDSFLSGKKISAGTSQDFEIALEEGIDIVRIGRKILL